MSNTTFHGWLFGDVGRPLMDDWALSVMLSQVPTPAAKQILDISKRYEKAIGRKRPKVQKQILQATLEDLSNVCANLSEAAREELEQEYLSTFNANPEFNIQIEALPWKPETLEAFASCEVDVRENLNALESLQWGEVMKGSASGLLSVFDIYQMIYSYLPTAVDENLLAGADDTLDIEVEKFEKSIMLRSGLAGNYQAKWQELLSFRNGWGRAKKSLEILGTENDISRERVRQIEEVLSSIVESRSYPISKSILRIVSLDYGSRLADPLLEISKNLTISDDWTLDGLANFIEASSSSQALIAFKSRSEPDASQKEEIRKIHQGIREARTVIGVILLTGVKASGSQLLLSKDLVIEHLPYVYGNCLISGDYAVVSRGKGAGIFTSISNQLSICATLHVDQLRVGIERHATPRQAQHIIPPAFDLLKIIEQNSDFTVDSSGNVSGRTEDIPVENVQGWLVQQILNSNGNVVSKAHILRLALAQGFRLNSVSVYMSFSPVIRSLGEGLLTLVGASPTNVETRYAERVAEASYIQNRIVDYKFDPTSKAVVIRFVFSTPFLISGVLAVDKSLGLLLGSSARSIQCCSDIETDAFAKLSKGTNLAGLASIREHMMVDHGINEGDTVTLEAGPSYLKILT